MVWNGKGRSGIGDTNIQGAWEDWDGLSPNGRQYKNAITQETRNLSGADYWHARKADNARMLDKALPNHFKSNGAANISAYAESEVKKGNKGVENLEYKLFPQQKTLDNLEKLELELFRKFDQGVMDSEEFEEANHALQIKKQRAWKSLCKAKGWYDEIDELSPEEKAIEKEKERIGRAYYKELQAHNKAIEKELRQAYRVGNKNAVKRITGRSSWWEKLHGIKIVVIVWIIITILAKMGGG